jgi:hypothetical protein
MNATTFRCATCAELHDLAELSFGADAPEQWNLLSEAEREASELTPDQCVLETTEGTHRFIRCCLEVPIFGTARAFTWGVWCSLSEASFVEMARDWEAPERVRLGPYFGWLSTRIPGYPETMFLKASVRQREVGLRPLVELAGVDHPLVHHQRAGIQASDLERMVASLLHDGA